MPTRYLRRETRKVEKRLRGIAGRDGRERHPTSLLDRGHETLAAAEAPASRRRPWKRRWASS
jgi:hypothetical protein